MSTARVERTEGGYRAVNDRGGEVAISGEADGAAFTPVELLLAALGGCEIVTVEPLTAQRGHRLARLAATVQADKVATSRLGTVTITYDVELPENDERAAEVFEAVAGRVHERYCTVGRALEDPTETRQILPTLR